MQMLNVFEPNAWQMDIPAWPATAVRIDAYRLGNDVPTAPTVSPITVDEMPVAQPKRSRQTVITYAHAESQSAESSNASM